MNDRIEEMNAEITRLSDAAKLTSWNDFVRSIDIPADLSVALLTGRAELIACATPREMSKAECASLYRLIGSLMETNLALREHANETAKLVDHWTDGFKHLISLGHRIDHYANFRRTDE
jgi:hypothetical protein